MRRRLLTTILRWLTVLLILRVTVTILANYPDYYPPNFDSLFLRDRESTFTSVYQPAFYIHIITAPMVLLNGLLLMNDSLRRHHGKLHRISGRVQVGVLLLLMLPSGVVMAQHSFAGWPSGLSFLLLSATTGVCAIMGVVAARRRRFDQHRRWMTRCFVLICSAITLRLLSGAMGLLDLPNPEEAYVIASWSSWLVPLAVVEIAGRWLETRR
ncbi:DUF2306 domain-containing protein [Zavarzinella formosa]|uniref:DUF2306 domain-containing protein n=1 Tax=Zavarzinella formosa TaxID=360055 RepID=UPI001EE63A90|nr:DUF2306 domain-containing protein [Zavarzinella formosa]